MSQPLSQPSGGEGISFAGPFKKLALEFKINKTKWLGSVVAGREELFFIQMGQENALALAPVFGLVGAVLAVVASRPVAREPVVRTCKFRDIPESVRSDRAWPPRRFKPNPDVLIVPKSQVPVIRRRHYTNLLCIELPDNKLTIQYPPFTGRSRRRFLESTGWPVQW